MTDQDTKAVLVDRKDGRREAISNQPWPCVRSSGRLNRTSLYLHIPSMLLTDCVLLA